MIPTDDEGFDDIDEGDNQDQFDERKPSMEYPQKPHISSRDEEERRIHEYQEKQREQRR